MSLRQQIIDDHIDSTAKLLNLKDRDMAFLRLVHSVITGQSIHAFNPSDLVDGSFDKQIDTITIEDSKEDEATVYIIQVKNTDSFESNKLALMKNGLSWIFDKPKLELQTLKNQSFIDRISAYRSTQGELGASNIRLVVAFVTKGHTNGCSVEFNQEAKSIKKTYDNGTFESFNLKIWGSDELVEAISAAEKRTKKINADIKMKYDANNPSLIKFHAVGLKGMVCSVPGREIAKLVNADKSGYLFDSNIRRFLGERGNVNSDIRNTCISSAESHQFWFLNNGITIVCDSFDAVTDPDQPVVKIKNIQIVNGCQTATTLARAAKDRVLHKDVLVLLRIYEAPPVLVNKIVLTTNNQNRISSRDLRANDSVQVEMEQRFNKYKLLYERKVRQYDKMAGVDPTRIAPNELVAQSYLAVVLRKPSDARRRKYRVWSDLYSKIFDDGVIEPFVLSFLLYKSAVKWLKESGSTESSDDTTRRLAKNGAFHIARIGAFFWRGVDQWTNIHTMPRQIESLMTNEQIISPHFEAAMSAFKNVVAANPAYANDLDGAMKSNNLDGDIERYLHKNTTKAAPKTTSSKLNSAKAE
ncbi:AIPR family protein [Schlesneria sp. T3-172]|uniref:AIPR family protein n=1 Tax=Schlesneria sphaerica TaxID=3373610 RepID=UPI0037C85E9E